MRNPNGYGSISKLPGKRRKPIRVRITVGWEIIDKATGEVLGTRRSTEGIPEDLLANIKLKQLYKPIGYFKTRPEAMLALAEYHKNPHSFDVPTVTFTEIFNKWSEEKYTKTSHSSVNGYNAAYKLSSSLYEMVFVDIRKSHMQAVIDNCNKGYGTRKKIKVLFNQLYKYAMENDIVVKDYSAYVVIGKNESESNRKPFTQEEIQILFDNVNRMDFIDTILIMIYTGLRIGELLLIETANVDLENRTMKGGLKTEAGKNRIIPINKKILPFIAKRQKEGHKYLIVNHENNLMKYWNYKEEKWAKIIEQLEMEHLPHDCRHTFATLMDNAGANKVSIKRIMGHSSTDITDKVYTHKDIEELIKAIDLI